MSAIHFSEEGSGHPLLFLHGFCDSHELWTDFIRPFTKHYRVLTPDLPGFGQSTILPFPFTLDHVGDAIALWMKEQHVEKPLVIGHSLGGYVAMSLLARHAALIEATCLFHSTPNPDAEERRKVRDKVIAFVEENGIEPFIETFVPGLFLDKNNLEIASTNWRAMKTQKASLIGYAAAMRDRPDRSDVFIHSPVPLLLIAGVKDSIIAIEDLRKIAEKAPKCQFFELQQAAHMGLFEAKSQCQAIISGFSAHLWPNKGI